MTPAINTAKKAKIEFTVHEYNHDAAAESYGLEAAHKLGIPENRVFKTLVVKDGGEDLFVGVVPVSTQLNLKLMARAVGVKKVSMADARKVESITGYVLGGVSPIGQKKRLKTVIDSSAQNFETINVSAGKRGLEIELSASDLQKLTNAKFAEIKSPRPNGVKEKG